VRARPSPDGPITVAIAPQIVKTARRAARPASAARIGLSRLGCPDWNAFHSQTRNETPILGRAAAAIIIGENDAHCARRAMQEDA
jgi:hypothetical protein